MRRKAASVAPERRPAAVWDSIRAVWARELLDTVRDKRTLYMMILLPIVIMPLVMMIGPVVMIRQQEAMQEQTAVIAFHGAAPVAELTSWLETTGGFVVESDAHEAVVMSPAGAVDGVGAVGAPGGGSGANAGDDSLAALEARLQDGDIHLIVSMGDDAAARWEAREPISLELVYYAGSSRSTTALHRFEAALQAFGAQVGAVRLAERGLPAELVQPFQVTSLHDITPEEQFAGQLLASFIPFFIVVWAVMGGMYTAIDAAAGEKERNSLESLVMAPTSTSALVIGKFLAVTTVTLVAVMLLIASSVVSMLYVMPRLMGEEAMAVSVNAGNLAFLFVVMTLFVALMSAIELGFSVYSKSYREAQAYMTALAFLVMLPSMYLMFAETAEVALWTYAVPVLNVLFIVRDVLEGSLPGAAPLLLTLGSLVVSVGVALWLTQRAFRNERVIFRA